MTSRLPTWLARSLRPFPEMDGPTRRAWSATQAAPETAAHLLGWQLMVAGTAAASAAVLWPAAFATTAVPLIVAAVALGLGIYLRFGVAPGELSVDRSITATVLMVAAIVAVARPAGLLPLLYLWPLLVTAAHAPPGRVTAQVALVILSFAVAAFTVADVPDPAVAVLVVASVTCGVALTVRRMRLEVARLFGALEEMSCHDPLTGALTAEAFERAFGAWVGRGVQRRLESAIVLLDIDNLDTINRHHGTGAGDAALRQLVRIVHEAVRETDAVGRIEDDEFGLVLPATDGDSAVVVAERIRATLERRSLDGHAPFTVSIGVTGSHAFLDPWAAARRALELAKTSGGNCVVRAETETATTPLDERIVGAA